MGSLLNIFIVTPSWFLYGFSVGIQQNLHIVLIMDCFNSNFTINCESNPAFYRKCSVQWMEGWSESSMMQVSFGGKDPHFDESIHLIAVNTVSAASHYIALLIFVVYLCQVLKILFCVTIENQSIIHHILYTKVTLWIKNMCLLINSIVNLIKQPIHSHSHLKYTRKIRKLRTC